MTVSSAHATQVLPTSTPKATPIPFLLSDKSLLCTVEDRGYSALPLTIAKSRQKGLMTAEIIALRTDTLPAAEGTPEPVPTNTHASIAVEIASPSGIPVVETLVTPTPLAGSSGSLDAEILFSLVNQTRAASGLPAFQKHPDVCSVAYSRAPELDNEIYGNSYMHAGFQARNLPFRATENMISQQTEQEALNWWMNSPIHRSAIMGGTTYACTACQGKSCAMIFSNLEPTGSVY